MESSRTEQTTGSRRTPQSYRVCDAFTEAVLYFMVLFAPWAFGTTERWSAWTMNIAGYFLGSLLLTKWLIRWRNAERGTRQAESETRNPKPEARNSKPNSGLTRLLAVLTILMLAYCFVSA